MVGIKEWDDWLTLAAVGVLAMCVVTFDHEALGHGGVCLCLGGHIRLLTSSLFRCDLRSGWIDPAGPAANLLMGTLALAALRLVPSHRASLRLFLIAVTAFSYFWEAGYGIHAMHRRDGDLYFFAQFLLGNVSVGARALVALAAVALYVFAAWHTSRAILTLWPDRHAARRALRILWAGATAGAAIAALAYTGSGWGDLRDAVREIGMASFPLLILPLAQGETGAPQALIGRNPALIGLAIFVYAAFVVTLGRGLAL